MRMTSRILTFAVVLVGALTACIAPAHAATITKTVPGTLEVLHGANPENPGNCGANAFVKWKHVPGTTRAVAKYRSLASSRPGAEFVERSEAGTPPYSDTFDWIFDAQVTPGYHWISISSGWRAGPTPSDCRDTYDAIMARLDHSAGATRVELTIDVPDPVIVSHRTVQLVPRSRLADLGTIRCPVGGSCTVVAPKTVNVRINRTAYRLSVIVPKTIRGGKTVPVRVQLPPAAATALTRRTVRPTVRIRARNQTAPFVIANVARTLRR